VSPNGSCTKQLTCCGACGCASTNTKIEECTNGREADASLPRMWYHASTTIEIFPTDEALIASRYDSPLGRKVTERVLTDTLYATEFLPPIGRRGSERLYDLVDNVCPEAGDVVRKVGREVGLDLG